MKGSKTLKLQGALQGALLGALSLSGCATDEGATLNDDQAVCETGKCDSVSRVVDDLYNDMRRVDLSDLVSIGAGFATDEVNGLLSELPYVDLKISDTSLFALEERELFGEVITANINTLQAGLTQRLGEEAFASQINKLRVKTLEQNPGAVFAESHFRVGVGVSESWTVNHGDRVGQVGFTLSPSVEAIVIAPHSSVSEAVYASPLEALKASRGFIFPRSAQEVAQMEPGSSVTLRGEGGVGFNFGVGVPLVTGVMTDYLTISSRLSAAARTSLKGKLDIQLIRGEGADVFVDVGLSRQQLQHYELAVESGWGVEGLPTLELDVAGLKVDLADVLEKSLERQLNKQLAPFDARANNTEAEGRLSVARFEFNLGRLTPETEQALAQVLRGDLRLAQALANRPNSGVSQHFELNKEYQRESDYLGFRFLSMRFFMSESEKQGVVNVGANGENQELLFSEMESQAGWFFTERGAKWRQLTSVKSVNRTPVEAQNNARMSLREYDRFINKDQILDHIDPLLAYFYGPEAVFYEIGALTDTLSEYVDNVCGNRPDAGESYRDRQAFDACVESIPNMALYNEMVQDAYAVATDLPLRWGSDFDPAFSSTGEVARRLLDLKVGLSGIHDTPNVALDGPKGTLISQVRFSHDAVRALMSADAPERFGAELSDILMMMHSDRDDKVDEKVEDAEAFARSRADEIEPIVAAYREVLSRFEQYDDIAQLNLPSEGKLGDTANLLMIPKRNPTEAKLSSIAALKGELVGQLFEALTSAARGLREPDQFLIGYALLSLAQPADLELFLSFKFDPEHRGDYTRYDTSLYTRGEASFIDAGQFSVDDLIGAE